MRIPTAIAGGLAAVVCALVAVACSSSGSPNASATRSLKPAEAQAEPAGLTTCPMSQLAITLIDTGALGGQAGGLLRFTNNGTTACTLTGWPMVAGVTASGTATTLRHARSTMFGAWRYSAPLPDLRLRPRASAYAVVAADDQPAGSTTRCPAPDVRLRVSAPGSASSVMISAWLPGARSYLPTCPSINGSPTGEVSTITTLIKIASSTRSSRSSQ